MTPRIIFVALRIVVVGALGACESELPPITAGKPCRATSDCGEGFECVIVNGDDSTAAACFPVIAREITGCGADNDCFDEGFPVEAECRDSECFCTGSLNCAGDEQLDARVCACKLRRGALCSDDSECASGVCGGVDGENCLADLGESCTIGEECASGDCNGDFCA